MKCGSCPKEFVPVKPNQKYCSNACKQKAYMSRRLPSVTGNLPSVTGNLPSVTGNLPSVTADFERLVETEFRYVDSSIRDIEGDIKAVNLRVDNHDQQIKDLERARLIDKIPQGRARAYLERVLREVEQEKRIAKHGYQ